VKRGTSGPEPVQDRVLEIVDPLALQGVKAVDATITRF